MTGRFLRHGSRSAAEMSTFAYALDKLLSRSLRMFDGRSTVPLRWDGPGVVMDLSAVPTDSRASRWSWSLPQAGSNSSWPAPAPARAGPRRNLGALANRPPPPTSRAASSWPHLASQNLCPVLRSRTSWPRPTTAPPRARSPPVSRTRPRRSSFAKPRPARRRRRPLHSPGPEASIVGQLTRGRALWNSGGRTAVVSTSSALASSPSSTPTPA